MCLWLIAYGHILGFPGALWLVPGDVGFSQFKGKYEGSVSVICAWSPVNFKDNFTLFHWHVVCPTSPNQLDCIKCSKPFIFPVMTVTKGSVWAFETAFYLQSTPSQHLGQWSGERGFSTDCALCLILLSPFLTRESNRTLNLMSMSECWECAGVQLMKKSSLAHDFPWSDLPQQLSFTLFVS